MSDLERVTGRPSYSGLSADQLRRSARITADAWGRAYILTTVSIPDWRAGGHVFVSREPNPPWPGAPYAILETVEGE